MARTSIRRGIAPNSLIHIANRPAKSRAFAFQTTRGLRMRKAAFLDRYSGDRTGRPRSPRDQLFADC